MAGAAFWGNSSHVGDTFSDDPFDVVFVGGDPLPGICRIKGLSQLEIDKKKQKGSNGVALTVTGFQPGPFEITVKVWTEEQDQFLQAWLDKFWIAPQKERPEFTTKKVRSGSNADGSPLFKSVSVKNRAPQVALDISHPNLSRVGIDRCVIQGVSIPEAGPEEGTMVINIKLIDGRANDKKTVIKTAKGSSNNVKLAKELSPKAKTDTPKPPSQEREDLGPKGPRPKPASGSD